MLPDKWRASARQRGLSDAQINQQARRFRNHWMSTTKDPRKRDWEATWDNWIDREVEKHGLRPAGNPAGNDARQPELRDMSGDEHESRRFLTRVGVEPDKPWPGGIGPQSLYHPTVLLELGLLATKGSS